MRIRGMKNVWKRIGIFVLAFLLAVPMTGGWSETVRADVPGGNFCKIVVEQKDENKNVLSSENGDMMSLEKEDTLTLKIVATGKQPNVFEITGSLVFINEKGEDIGECFEEICEDDYGTALTDADYISVHKTKRYHEFQLVDTSSSGVDIDAGDEILWINLRVKRAVDKDVCIKFQGADPNKNYCFELKRRPANPVVVDYTPINTTITNKWFDERKLSFTVAGNSERADDSAIDVPVKATNTKKTRIAVRINKDNGINKGTNALGYATFTLSYTYNPEYLSLATDGEKEIYYELSDNVKNYEEKVDDITIIPPPAQKVYEGDRRRITVTFMSRSGEDIRVYGDFLYLTFVPANGSQKLGLADDEANVEVTLMDGQNSSRTNMKTEVSSGAGYSGTNYLDPGKKVWCGTRTFRVNFVKSLIRFGDVNNDTYINLIDALMVLQYCNDSDEHKKYPLTVEQKERANVDDSIKDGKPDITLKDVYFIIQYVNGAISELPVKNPE